MACETQLMSISLVGFATRFNLLRRHATWALADTDHLNQYESILVKRSQILITWCQYGSILVKDSLALITWCQSRQCGKRSWRGLEQHGLWSGPIIQSVWEEVLAWP